VRITDKQRPEGLPPLPPRVQAQGEAGSGRAEGANADAPRRADRVEVSDRARNLQQARRALEATPEVREAKVAELRQRIAEGRHNVRGELIADRMLRQVNLSALI
jgi:negative regulator of flagellin synthesis FlgM